MSHDDLFFYEGGLTAEPLRPNTPRDPTLTTAVQERSVWNEDAVRCELGALVSAFSTVRLGLIVQSAKEQADRYLNNPFVTYDQYGEPDLEDPQPIPATVEEGVLEYVRGYVGKVRAAIGVTSETVDRLSRSYDPAAVHNAALFAASPLWDSHRLTPGWMEWQSVKVTDSASS